ncbi:MAG: hypothetical protein LBM28_03940 [Oscillospiraceae bacterium]|jgi:hypothetical protein|nr:hypothetical protein [Oscillospiraceae bacterium]
MKAEDLFRAIGEAKPEYLEDSEKSKKFHGNAARRIALIAAALTALCVTAMAFPAVRSWITGASLRETQSSTILVHSDGSQITMQGRAGVQLALEMPADAPATVETYYVPLYLAENWTPTQNRVDDIAAYTQLASDRSYLGWWQGEQWVNFTQYAAPGYAGDYDFDSVELGYNAKYSSGEKHLSGLDLQYIIVEPSSLSTEEYTAYDGGSQKYYWSDGSYIFVLECNFAMDDAQLTRIFDSITAVESIAPYQNLADDST